MNQMHVLSSCAIGALFVAASADAALVDLTPGIGAAVNGTTPAIDTVLQGTIQEDTSIPFQILGAGDVLLFEGELQSRVVLSNDSGDYNFAYRIKNVNGGLNGIVSTVTVSDYTGMSTQVEWTTTSVGDVGPSRAQRSNDGADIDWLFGNGFPAGQESHFLYVVTEEEQYSFTGSTTIMLTTGESVTLTTWIPAPGTLALVPMLGLAAARRRR